MPSLSGICWYGSSRIYFLATVYAIDPHYLLKKIVVIGPESTGKSTLTEQLALHFQCPMVEEFARTYINRLTRPYRKEDLLTIARGQLEWEDKYRENLKPYLFCDTDLRVIKIWSQFKYQDVHPWIDYKIVQREYHAYLLTDIDFPWEADPQREHPAHREQLFDIYRKEVESSGLPWTTISGAKEERLSHAIDFILHLPQ